MKNKYKARKGRARGFIGHIKRMSPRAMKVLNICLPMILISLIALVLKLDDAVKNNPSTVMSEYPRMFEYILASLMLAIGGALLVDVVEKKDKGK